MTWPAARARRGWMACGRGTRIRAVARSDARYARRYRAGRERDVRSSPPAARCARGCALACSGRAAENSRPRHVETLPKLARGRRRCTRRRCARARARISGSLREFLEEHLGDGRPLCAFATWEGLAQARSSRTGRARVILGTAGHIDHGKTSLVRALTGVDTDRLPEEKKRGITIELGFAPLALASEEFTGTVGVVDVPGHDAFVRTMLAGATGVDLRDARDCRRRGRDGAADSRASRDSRVARRAAAAWWRSPQERSRRSRLARARAGRCARIARGFGVLERRAWKSSPVPRRPAPVSTICA